MAEINIERKERSALPAVLIGLVLLALLAWWLLGRAGPGETTVFGDPQPGEVADPAAGEPPRSVNEYVMFVDRWRGRADWGTDHEYVADGLRHLADAIDDMADDDWWSARTGMGAGTQPGTTPGTQPGMTGTQPGTTTGAGAGTQPGMQREIDLSQQTDQIRAAADSLQSADYAPRHSMIAQQAFVVAANALEMLQTQRYTQAQAQIQPVREAATELDANRPLLDQRQQVDNFFDRSANALRTMTQQTTY